MRVGRYRPFTGADITGTIHSKVIAAKQKRAAVVLKTRRDFHICGPLGVIVEGLIRVIAFEITGLSFGMEGRAVLDSAVLDSAVPVSADPVKAEFADLDRAGWISQSLVLVLLFKQLCFFPKIS